MIDPESFLNDMDEMIHERYSSIPQHEFVRAVVRTLLERYNEEGVKQ
jgi:hypothetical protein